VTARSAKPDSPCDVCGVEFEPGERYWYHARLGVYVHSQCAANNLVRGEDISAHTVMWGQVPDAPDADRPAAQDAPAAPPVGTEASGVATGPQIAVRLSLGDTLRHIADSEASVLGGYVVERLAERADALERGGRELGRQIERYLTWVLDATGMHHLIDEDGDGDWELVWDRLRELGERAKRAEVLERERDAAVRDFQNVGQANLLLAARLAAVRTLAVAWGMDANDFADDGKRYDLARDHVEALHKVLDGGAQ